MSGPRPAGDRRPRATVREVPRGDATWRDGPGAAEARATAGPPNPPRPAAGGGSSVGLRRAWASRPVLRLVAAVALVVVGTALAVGVSAGEFAALVLAATVVAVAEAIRGALEAGSARRPDSSGARPQAETVELATGAVAVASVGALVVAVVVIGTRLFGAFS